jgi:hypothetical protein
MSGSNAKRKKRLNDGEPDFTKLAEAAFLQASYKVVERAIQTGTPVILWKNGKVVAVDPHTIKLPRPKGARSK